MPCSCISNVKKTIHKNYDVGIMEQMIKKKKFYLKAKHPSLDKESLKSNRWVFYFTDNLNKFGSI